MKNRYTRPIAACAITLLAVLVFGRGRSVKAGGQAPAKPAGQAAPPGRLLSDQAFKNIQAGALKGIPVDDFILTMGIMTSALGFDCADCHDKAGTEKVDWAADTPRKITARNMVNMVTAINKDYFKGRQVVTCFSCHRNR